MPILENNLKTLSEINKKRLDIQNSDMLYREAILSLTELDELEKAVWEEQDQLGISKGKERTSYKETMANAISVISTLTDNPVNVNEVLDDMENRDDPSLIDKIGDGIVDGIMKFGEAVSAPFEWLSGVR